MGLANLLPGASGGTVLLALGLYGRFINALSQVGSFRFKRQDVFFLGALSVTAIVVVLVAAGPIKLSILENTMPMYSLFLGFTLGGLPLIWSEAKPARPCFYFTATIAFALSATLSLGIPVSSPTGPNPYLLFLAGLFGAAAMVLPGISGGYLVLLLGQYLPILSAISDLAEIVATLEMATREEIIVPCLTLLPVGIGAIFGIVTMSKFLKFSLIAYPQVSFGLLGGLVLGSAVRLWPFQGAIQSGDTNLAFQRYNPTGTELVVAAVLVVGAFCLPLVISRFGKREKPR